MYCPKCGEELSETRDGFVCEPGGMQLTQFLGHLLWECYVAETKEPGEARFDFRVGGEWFCPGCGVPTQERDGYVRCPQCGRSLNVFIRALIERHPHFDEKADGTGD